MKGAIESLFFPLDQMSISQLSQTGIQPDIVVPELSYGINPRMPSASAAVEVRYTPEKGRFFVANQDLSPGKEGSVKAQSVKVGKNNAYEIM